MAPSAINVNQAIIFTKKILETLVAITMNVLKEHGMILQMKNVSNVKRV